VAFAKSEIDRVTATVGESLYATTCFAFVTGLAVGVVCVRATLRLDHARTFITELIATTLGVIETGWSAHIVSAFLVTATRAAIIAIA
jgi:hypothetical protein